MKITFCGHRQLELSKEESESIKNFLVEKIKACPNATFYLGGYGDFDNTVFELLKEIQKDFPKIELIFVSPYLDPSYAKLSYAKEIYDDIIYPPIEKVPKKFAILKRNEWMVDQSDFVVSYVKYPWGGAGKTLDYAVKKHKPYVNFAQSTQ